MTKNDFAQIRQLIQLFMDQNNNQFNSNLILPKSHLNTKKIPKKKTTIQFWKINQLAKIYKTYTFLKKN